MSEAQAEAAAEAQAEETAGQDAEQHDDEDAPLKRALHAERQTVKQMKAELAALRTESEKARLATLSDAEKAVEEARKAGYEEAMSGVRADLARARVAAAAAAAGFADPADAHRLVDLADAEDDAAATALVAKLAKAKPYLIARKAAEPEQGPRGKAGARDESDWLREAMRR